MKEYGEEQKRGILYLCAVPIGNEEDISLRCVRILRSVGYIAAEHPSKSKPFLEHLGISQQTVIAYSGRSREEQGQKIVDLLQSGFDVALITDAGMPAVADPGEGLVRLCAENGITVMAVPGACAFVSALAVSGLETGRFCFEGFLSMNRNKRRKHLDGLKNERRTMIFYEAPQKLPFTLKDLLETLGERKITLCADLTKESEETIHTTLSRAVTEAEAIISYQSEYVLVIEGKTEKNE